MSTRTQIVQELTQRNVTFNMKALAVSLYTMITLSEYKLEYINEQLSKHPELKTILDVDELLNLKLPKLKTTSKATKYEQVARVMRKEQLSDSLKDSHSVITDMANDKDMDYHSLASIILRGKALNDDKLHIYTPRSDGKDRDNVTLDLVTETQTFVDLTIRTQGIGPMYAMNTDMTEDNSISIEITREAFETRTLSDHAQMRLQQRQMSWFEYHGVFTFSPRHKSYFCDIQLTSEGSTNVGYIMYLERFPIHGQSLRVKVVNTFNGEAIVYAARVEDSSNSGRKFFTNIYEITDLDSVLRMLTHQQLFKMVDFMMEARGQSRQQLDADHIAMLNLINLYTGLPRAFAGGEMIISEDKVTIKRDFSVVLQPPPHRIGMGYGEQDLGHESIKNHFVTNHYDNYILPYLLKCQRMMVTDANLIKLNEGLQYIYTNDLNEEIPAKIMSKDGEILEVIIVDDLDEREITCPIYESTRDYANINNDGKASVDYRTVIVIQACNSLYSKPLVEIDFAKEKMRSGESVSSLQARMMLLPPVNTLINKENKRIVTINYDSIIVRARESEDTLVELGLIYGDKIYYRHEDDEDGTTTYELLNLAKLQEGELIRMDEPKYATKTEAKKNRKDTEGNYTASVLNPNQIPGNNHYSFTHYGDIVTDDSSMAKILCKIHKLKTEILNHANSLYKAGQNRYYSGVGVVNASLAHKTYFSHILDGKVPVFAKIITNDRSYCIIPSQADIILSGYDITPSKDLTLRPDEISYCVVDILGNKLDPTPIIAGLAKLSQREVNKRKPLFAMTHYHTFLAYTMSNRTTVLLSNRSNTSTASGDSVNIKYNTGHLDKLGKIIFEKIKSTDASLFVNKKPLLRQFFNNKFVGSKTHHAFYKIQF